MRVRLRTAILISALLAFAAAAVKTEGSVTPTVTPARTKPAAPSPSNRSRACIIAVNIIIFPWICCCMVPMKGKGKSRKAALPALAPYVGEEVPMKGKGKSRRAAVPALAPYVGEEDEFKGDKATEKHGRLVCERCSARITSNSMLVKHYHQEHKVSFDAMQGHHIFYKSAEEHATKTKAEMTDAEYEVLAPHDDLKKFKCKLCDGAEISKRAALKHFKDHHNRDEAEVKGWLVHKDSEHIRNQRPYYCVLGYCYALRPEEQVSDVENDLDCVDEDQENEESESELESAGCEDESEDEFGGIDPACAWDDYGGVEGVDAEPKFELTVEGKYYDMFLDGRKTKEGRLGAHKWRRLEAGDIGQLVHATTDARVTVRVTETPTHHPTFRDMLQGRYEDFLPDAISLDAAVKTYYGFNWYKTGEKKNGSVCIPLEVISANTGAMVGVVGAAPHSAPSAGGVVAGEGIKSLSSQIDALSRQVQAAQAPPPLEVIPPGLTIASFAFAWQHKPKRNRATYPHTLPEGGTLKYEGFDRWMMKLAGCKDASTRNVYFKALARLTSIVKVDSVDEDGVDFKAFLVAVQQQNIVVKLETLPIMDLRYGWARHIVFALNHLCLFGIHEASRLELPRTKFFIERLQRDTVEAWKNESLDVKRQCAQDRVEVDGLRLENLPPAKDCKAAVHRSMLDLAVLAIVAAENNHMGVKEKFLANVALAGIIIYGTFAGRSGEWHRMVREKVKGKMERGDDMLIVGKHKTAQYYGAIAKWIPPGLRRAFLVYCKLPNKTSDKFFEPASVTWPSTFNNFSFGPALKAFGKRYTPSYEYPRINLIRKMFHSVLMNFSREGEVMKEIGKVDGHSAATGLRTYALSDKKQDAALAKRLYTTVFGEPVPWPSQDDIDRERRRWSVTLAELTALMDDNDVHMIPDNEDDEAADNLMDAFELSCWDENSGHAIPLGDITAEPLGNAEAEILVGSAPMYPLEDADRHHKKKTKKEKTKKIKREHTEGDTDDEEKMTDTANKEKKHRGAKTVEREGDVAAAEPHASSAGSSAAASSVAVCKKRRKIAPELETWLVAKHRASTGGGCRVLPESFFQTLKDQAIVEGRMTEDTAKPAGMRQVVRDHMKESAAVKPEKDD